MTSSPRDETRPSGLHPLAAVGFDRAAAEYERARPSYPDDAVAFVVDRLGIGPGRRVLDLAAGTGKFTRLLVPTGADLVAVEPLAAMRAQLVEALGAGGPDVRDGRAEALPLPDDDVDAVVCAQAWHWFDAAAALAEVRRVGRAGAGLAVIYNIRDESVAWVRELTRVTEFTAANRPHHRTSRRRFAAEVAADGGYGPVTLATFRHHQVLDEDGLVERALSQSNVASMAPEHRAEVVELVRTLARTHPDLAGRPSFELPYDTEVAVCHLL
jgi:ubiquinone/menaquinone biosynthesis C-methylase UbiE